MTQRPTLPPGEYDAIVEHVTFVRSKRKRTLQLRIIFRDRVSARTSALYLSVAYVWPLIVETLKTLGWDPDATADLENISEIDCKVNPTNPLLGVACRITVAEDPPYDPKVIRVNEVWLDATRRVRDTQEKLLEEVRTTVRGLRQEPSASGSDQSTETEEGPRP